MKLKKKQLLAVFMLAVSLIVNTLQVQAAFPAISSGKYMKAYVLSGGNNTRVYTSSSLRTQGTSYPYKAYNAVIYKNDEIYIYSINSTYAYISYPTSSGRKKGYVRTSDLTPNNWSAGVSKSRAKITARRRPGDISNGCYIAKGDTVYTVARRGNYVQAVYPSGSMYRMAWITNTEYDSYIAAQSVSSLRYRP